MAAPSRIVLLKVASYFPKELCKSYMGFICCSKFNTSTIQSEDASKSRSKEPVKKSQKISKAMLVYLKKAKEHEKIVEEQTQDYELGRRHLANIMGVDQEDFTQEDINKAIRYLLPSGLHEKKARPKFKHPSEVFEKRRAAAYNVEGRPHHHLFYTLKPMYYGLMHEVSEKVEALKTEYFNAKGQLVTRNVIPLNLSTSKWINTKTFKAKFPLEQVDDNDYRRFIILMERLANLRFARKEYDFIMSFREQLLSTQDIAVPESVEDEDTGRNFSEKQAQRKTSRAKVRVYAEGTGIIDINGEGIDYFDQLLHRKAVLFPLSFVNLINKVDIHVTTSGGGPSGQAGAIRYALAKALRAHTTSAVIEKMKFAGLLTNDIRRKERKKPGQFKARKEHTWKAR